MWDRGTAPDQQRTLPCAQHRGAAAGGTPGERSPVGDVGRMERVVERRNRLTALARVKANGGSPGVDGRTVEALPGSLQQHWLAIRAALRSGRHRPSPVTRVDIPNPGGGVRTGGIPTVLGRLLPQALLHVLQPAWAPTCSDHSDGFRPRRSAPQAIARAQQSLEEGYPWGVDLDREKVLDHVKPDKLRSLVKGRGTERRVQHLIDRYRKAGALTGDGCAATGAGPPQGGPLSPLFANLLLADLDQELERRGHRFVRDAAESHISVQSLRAGQRGLASGTRCLERRLQRMVNAAKSAGDRPWRRTFLGVTFTRRRPTRRLGSAQALKALKQEGRQRTYRTRGVPFRRVVQDLRQDLNGWSASVRCAAGQSIVKERDSWVRRRRRCSVWKQWGRHRYRELRRRGVRQDLAWHTGKSAHGPWRFSRSPALALALPGQHFARLGVPRLHQRSRR
jgi:group II intron reverse transcriptase/maturase